MEVINGKSVFGGIAIGKIKVYEKRDATVKRSRVEDTQAEYARFETAKEEAKRQLQALYDKALKEVGEVNAQIFEVHQMMLDDLDFTESVENIITDQGVNAEYAVATTGDNMATIFEAMDDEYFRGRAADIKDISERVIRILLGCEADLAESDEPVILVADDLAPSETVQLDKSKILAFVTRHGSTSSHTAILARTMNIPALIGVDYDAAVDGVMGAVDGYTGQFYIEPEGDTLTALKEKREEDRRKAELLRELKGEDNVTVDGKRIDIFANIGTVEDVSIVLDNDAGGIGLFRSEFLYLNADDFPTEEEQFQAYKKVLEVMAGKKVVIRTLDIGADKQVDYFNLDKEDNPALGYRAIRICLTDHEIFKTQLRAIYRASRYGQAAIMFPMITSVKEVRKIKEIVAEVQAELRASDVPFKEDVELGIMIETPAAAVISDLLAKEVDFFSVGTNDLSQYTLAIDRQNDKLEPFFDRHHPAVLRLIETACENAHKEGIWIGICGELGADVALTEQFLRMGIDELSVSPSMVLKVREKVRSLDLSK
ncbi:MAG: phosphoenolpyruvate--protein phosphotransferase [Eubacteriales bacterium]|nr:phosphoenolpyruvate--protein phosphotransferase [Eubacteriales bacterium]